MYTTNMSKQINEYNIIEKNCGDKNLMAIFLVEQRKENETKENTSSGSVR